MGFSAASLLWIWLLGHCVEGLTEQVTNGHDAAAKRLIRLDLFADLLAPVEHRRVISPAENGADLRQRGVGLLANQVHGHLTRQGDVLRPTTAEEGVRSHAVV